MSEEEFGFDPTIQAADGQRFIDIERNGQTERLVLDKVMICARCIAGRATTCWKAHSEGEPLEALVVKDLWQYLERDEECELLRQVASKDVINVARYYHHETVRIGNLVDDVRINVRRDLDITRAQNYRPERLMPSQKTSTKGVSRQGRSTASVKPVV